MVGINMTTLGSRLALRIAVAAMLGSVPACTVTQQAYLQDITVSGTHHLPPVRVTKGQKAGQISAVVGFGHATERDIGGLIPGHSKVNAQGKFQTDTVHVSGSSFVLRETPGANTRDFTGLNLHWSPTPNVLWIDLQLMASDGVALQGGYTFGTAGGASLSDWRVGIGFLGKSEVVGYRLDAGVQTGELRF